MTNRLLVIVLIALGIVFGMYVGKADYKASCEPVGNANQKWLECDL